MDLIMTCATILSLMAVKLSISLATILSMAEVASSAAGSPSSRCACCEWASPAISPDLRRFAAGAASSAVHTGGRSGRGLPRGWLRAGRGRRRRRGRCRGSSGRCLGSSGGKLADALPTRSERLYSAADSDSIADRPSNTFDKHVYDAFCSAPVSCGKTSACPGRPP